MGCYYSSQQLRNRKSTCTGAEQAGRQGVLLRQLMGQNPAARAYWVSSETVVRLASREVQATSSTSLSRKGQALGSRALVFPHCPPLCSSGYQAQQALPDFLLLLDSSQRSAVCLDPQLPFPRAWGTGAHTRWEGLRQVPRATAAPDCPI